MHANARRSHATAAVAVDDAKIPGLIALPSHHLADAHCSLTAPSREHPGHSLVQCAGTALEGDTYSADLWRLLWRRATRRGDPAARTGVSQGRVRVLRATFQLPSSSTA